MYANTWYVPRAVIRCYMYDAYNLAWSRDSQSIYRRHKVFLFWEIVVVLFLFFFLVPVNFACCWYPGELSPVAGVNTYHIMHSPCNTIPLSLQVSQAAGRPPTSLIHRYGPLSPPLFFFLMGIIGKGKMCRNWICLLTLPKNVPRMFNMQISPPLCEKNVLAIYHLNSEIHE